MSSDCQQLRLYTIISRNVSNDAKAKAEAEAKKKLLEAEARKKLMESTVNKFFAGASAIGLTVLAFCGLGVSIETDLDESLTWKKFGKERIRSTYGYFAGSLLFTAGSAISISRSPVLMKIISSNPAAVSFQVSNLN